MSKERPILFNADMVNAILDGRKSQTRRVVKPQPPSGIQSDLPGWNALARRCPYGKPGDRLWVRETWGVVSHMFDANGDRHEWNPDRPAKAIHEMPFGQGFYHGHVIYAADGGFEWAGDDDGGGEPRSAWKPSIHMPRLASRITLEIVSVRVQRLKDISKLDAEAEGVQRDEDMWKDYLHPTDCHFAFDARTSFATLWQSINGAESWDSNPWVWVVEFKRVEASQ